MGLADWVHEPRALDAADIEGQLRDLLDAYTPHGFRRQPAVGSRARLSGVTWELELYADLLPFGVDANADRSLIGRVERLIRVPLDEDRAPVAEHLFFELPPEHRGRGLGTAALARTVDVYQTAGLPQIVLDAAMYGRYVWAMCGFEFADDSTRNAVVDAAQQVADRFHAEGLCGPLDFSEVRFPWDIARVDEQISLADLAAFQGEPLEEVGQLADEDEKIDAGKAILLGDVPVWRGRFDARPDSLAVELLREYAGRDAEDEDA